METRLKWTPVFHLTIWLVVLSTILPSIFAMVIHNQQEQYDDDYNNNDFILEVMRKMNSNKQGRRGSQIKTKLGDKCLSVQLGAPTEAPLLTAKLDCSTKDDHYYWSWNGTFSGGLKQWDPTRLVILERGEGKLKQPGRCIDCWQGKKDCEVRVAGCHGKLNQGFTLSVHQNQMKPDHLSKGRFLFGIAAEYPDTCLTRKTKKFNPLNSKQSIDIDFFELQDCDGSEEQTFYVDEINMKWAKETSSLLKSQRPKYTRRALSGQ